MTQHPFREHHLLAILNEYDLLRGPLDRYLYRYFRANRALGSKDRKEVSERIYGLMRWKSLVEHLSPENADWSDKLRCFLSIDPEAYVHDEKIPAHIRVSFPKILFDHFVSVFGEPEAIRLCLVLNESAPTTIRANPGKTSRDQLFAELQKNFPVKPCDESPLGITFLERVPLRQIDAFQKGLFEFQDEGSQLLSTLVGAEPGQHVLDYCAGSGGKTLAFAHQLEGRGQIYLHDVRTHALDESRQRLKRAGVQNFQILAEGAPHLAKLKKKMDWVLVDAPCSGTGTLRRNPDMKWRFDDAFLTGLIGLQRLIFERALAFVKPGGKIVYATCSVLERENEEQVAHFLSTYSLEQVGAPFKVLPQSGGMDGFYGIVLKRR